MTNRFQRGLVVGKFSPLHRGHELVIRRALSECAEVVILSYSKPELPGCDASRRELWLAKLFPQSRRLVVTDEQLGKRAGRNGEWTEVPANDASEATHRRFCGYLCERVLGVTVDAVFTSEDYGDAFAAALTGYFRERSPGLPAVRHVSVDRARRTAPISGTAIRGNVHAHREWLSPEVYASFVKRVCLLGGESSGKSVLAEALASEFHTVHVAEFGRELWEAKAGALTFEDMQSIAEVQIEREEAGALRANEYLFCDTSPLTTLFYSQHLFGRVAPKMNRLAERAYDFTLLCAPDFEFVQDGTRQDEHFRARQHEWYLTELGRRGIEYVLIVGSRIERVRQVQDLLLDRSDITPIRSPCAPA